MNNAPGIKALSSLETLNLVPLTLVFKSYDIARFSMKSLVILVSLDYMNNDNLSSVDNAR